VKPDRIGGGKVEAGDLGQTADLLVKRAIASARFKGYVKR
jgi:hypothetical protein